MIGRDSRRAALSVALLLFMIMISSTTAIDKLGASIFKFIYSHEEICGDQFGDDGWMPAHDQCQLDCDLITEICQLSSDKQSLTNQRCYALPKVCAVGLRNHLYRLTQSESNTRRSSMNSANSDGMTLSGTTGEALHYGYSTAQPKNTVDRKEYERITVTSSPDVEDNLELVESDRQDFPRSKEVLKGLVPFGENVVTSEPEPASAQTEDLFKTTEYEDPSMTNNIFASENNPFEETTEKKERGENETKEEREHTESGYREVDVTSSTEAIEIDENTMDPRLEMPSSVPTPPSEVHIFGPPFLEKQRAAPTVSVDFPQPTEKMPSTLRELSLQSKKSPWSWNKLSDQLKKPWSLKNRPTEDLSQRCCQWALDGLCDRSWQRVRVLCPKSCGTVVCSSMNGAMTCNRAIDVDVVDCYEKRKSHLQSVSSRFYSDTSYETKIPIQSHEKTQSEKRRTEPRLFSNYGPHRDEDSAPINYAPPLYKKNNVIFGQNYGVNNNNGIYSTNYGASGTSFGTTNGYSTSINSIYGTSGNNDYRPSYGPNKDYHSSFGRSSSPAQRAYAIESEIRGFKQERGFG